MQHFIQMNQQAVTEAMLFLLFKRFKWQRVLLRQKLARNKTESVIIDEARSQMDAPDDITTIPGVTGKISFANKMLKVLFLTVLNSLVMNSFIKSLLSRVVRTLKMIALLTDGFSNVKIFVKELQLQQDLLNLHLKRAVHFADVQTKQPSAGVVLSKSEHYSPTFKQKDNINETIGRVTHGNCL